MTGDLEYAIKLSDVCRCVPTHGDPQQQVTLLNQINFKVPVGTLLHLVGPSGSGKSTLLRLLNRLDEASGGDIEILGKKIAHWPPRILRRQVAMLFQEPSLLGLSPRENFELAFKFAGLPHPDDFDSRVEQAVQQAGAQMDWLDRQTSQLSVGQRQRLVLARSLIIEPRIILLDELTASLDTQTAHALLGRLQNLCQTQQTTLLMVTHRLSEVQRLGGQLLVLQAGHVAYHGTVQDYDFSSGEIGHE